jgi:type VI secretion system protein ImpJ
MVWNSKVVWSEGLFIQPQHFQQADRYVETLVRGRVEGLRPFPWGLTELEINRDLLSTGRFAVTRMRGVLDDGTPISIPDEVDPPPALELPDTVRNARIYLTVPIVHRGGAEVADADASESSARYVAREIEVVDSVQGGGDPTRIAVGRLRARYALEADDRTDMVSLPIARMVEVRADRSAVVDAGYVPPCLSARASPILSGYLTEIEGLLHNRATELAGRAAEAGGKAPAEFGDYLLLMILNRSEPVATHLASFGTVHPEDFYRFAAGLAGELATITARSRRPPEFPPYRHDDLEATFAPVMLEIRRSLTTIMEQSAIKLPLQLTKFGVWYAPLADRTLLSGSSFVLSVEAAVPGEALRQRFPAQSTIGPGEQIRDLITAASRGIGVRPLPVAPRQLPYHAGRVYFELERLGPYWDAMRTSAGFAVHLAGEFPGLDMDLWAIRDRTG